MKINVTNLKIIKEKANCLARCSVILENAVAINDVFLMEGKNGRFLNFPQRPFTNKDGETEYAGIVTPLNKEVREQITLAVMVTYDKAVAEE